MSLILIVEDNEKNMKLVRDILQAKGYEIAEAGTAEDGIKLALERVPDLVLMDIQLPGMNGMEALKVLRAEPKTAKVPVVAITASVMTQDRQQIMDTGFDGFIEKPINLKLFLSTVQAAITNGGGEELLKTHRREISVVFIDLRGFTAFTDRAEPEEVMELLRAYHADMGRIILEHGGTLERFAGDAIMVFFNDPVPMEKPAENAVRMALAMRDAFPPIAETWSKRGYDLGLGCGVAQGYATLGAIGFEGRWDYAAIGNVTNLAARLCSEAVGGKVLVDRKIMAKVEGLVEAEPVGPLNLKGIAQPVPAFSVTGFRAAS